MKVRKKYLLQIKNKAYQLGTRTWLMGVVNITPDSFSDGGLYFDKEKAVQKGLELAAAGADIIDIGGESSRPGSKPISKEEEMRRVLPVIASLRKKIKALISIDTTKAEVAEAALAEGADILNDISAGRFDSKMIPLAAERKVPLILMHMKGTPQTMQINPYYQNLYQEVKEFLRERIKTAESYGIAREKIIIDPGLGFGKRFEDNLGLINNLSFLEELGCPLLVGISRKSFIGQILNLPPSERLEGTIAASILSLVNGAHILRVHDVGPVRRAVIVAEAILNQKIQPPFTSNQSKEKENYAG